MLLLLSGLLFFTADTLQAQRPSDKENQAIEGWWIRAIHDAGQTYEVVAMDAQGKIHPVRDIEDYAQSYIMEIVAWVDELPYSVKILHEGKNARRVAAIGPEGKILTLWAKLGDDEYLPVMGTERVGYIINVKAVHPESGEIIAVKALSPAGKLRDVKGVKMYEKDIESSWLGVDIQAHVVALPQIP